MTKKSHYFKGELSKEVGHSFVIDMNFVNAGSCRRCGKKKTHAGDWI